MLSYRVSLSLSVKLQCILSRNCLGDTVFLDGHINTIPETIPVLNRTNQFKLPRVEKGKAMFIGISCISLQFKNNDNATFTFFSPIVLMFCIYKSYKAVSVLRHGLRHAPSILVQIIQLLTDGNDFQNFIAG